MKLKIFVCIYTLKLNGIKMQILLHSNKGVTFCSCYPKPGDRYKGIIGALGIWGEWLFIFRELESTGNYFRGAREQAHNFGDLGSIVKKQKQ